MKWFDEEIKFLIDNYRKLSVKELENYLDHSNGSIRKKAGELNLTKKGWTEEDIKFLIENYKFRNKEDLLNNLNHTLKAIQNKASKLNITGIPINEDFFKEWTPEMVWVFGFWIADGNMFEKGNQISFASKDYDLIVKIKSLLKSGHKIYDDKNNVFILSMNNKILYNDILKLGGIPRKSLTIQFPEIPDEFLHHLIRGYLDGDGSNYIDDNGKYKYLHSSFTGNVDFLTTLKNKIEEYIGIETGKLYSKKDCNPRIKELRYNGKKAIALCDWIYQDSENHRLERKFKIYDQMKKEYVKKLEEKR